MSEGEKTKVVPPAKVHGDSGVTAVVAETETSPGEDKEARKEFPEPSRDVEAGMRS